VWPAAGGLGLQFGVGCGAAAWAHQPAGGMQHVGWAGLQLGMGLGRLAVGCSSWGSEPPREPT
jgi:hypothetical protein